MFLFNKRGLTFLLYNRLIQIIAGEMDLFKETDSFHNQVKIELNSLNSLNFLLVSVGGKIGADAEAIDSNRLTCQTM